MLGSKLTDLLRQAAPQTEATEDVPEVLRLKRNNLAAYQHRCRTDPEWFYNNVLGITPYAKQFEIAHAINESEMSSVNGANAVGKDWMIGRELIRWMEGHEPAKAIVTAPTGRQVKDIVWRETQEAYLGARIPLGGNMLPRAAYWNISANSFAFGFSTDKAWNITGFHSPHLLVIVSEAHNFADGHLNQIKRLHPERLLLSGNPLSEAGEFYESHHEKSNLYRSITISAWDTPNFIAGAEVVPGLVTLEDEARGRADWGEDSPDYKSTFKAEFAGRSDGLIRLVWLHAASVAAEDTGGPLRAGIDVAGPGDAETVLTLAEQDAITGNKIILQKAYRQDDSRGFVMADLEPYKGRLSVINIDNIGLGYFWPRDFRDAGFSMARGVNVALPPVKKARFQLLKDELYWGLRELFEAHLITGLHPTARGQLASLRWDRGPSGRVKVETKDEMRKRGVPSPDWAESTMLCFAPGGTLPVDAPATDEPPPPPQFANVRQREF